MKVAVVQGGPSSEAAVSRESARAVSRALTEAGHVPLLVELSPSLAGDLSELRPEVVFPVVHGSQGEDGCLQGLLEVLGLPYVGSDVRASAIAADKIASKLFFKKHGLPLASDRVIRARDLSSAGARELLEELRAELGRDLIVKPAQGGSTIGISRVLGGASHAELFEALLAAAQLDSQILVESYVMGKELTCGVLDRSGVLEALPVTLITSRATEWYDYESKYAPGGSDHTCPAPLSAATSKTIQNAALLAHQVVGATDLSRSDFILADSGELVLLELNTLPGMTEMSLFPEAAQAAGLSFPEVTDLLVKQARARTRAPALISPPLPGR